MNGVVFVISILSQLIYFYDAQSGLVEKCIYDYPLSLKVEEAFYVWSLYFIVDTVRLNKYLKIYFVYIFCKVSYADYFVRPFIILAI